VKIILHDDIVNNPDDVMKNLFQFLEVDYINIKNFEKVNIQVKITTKNTLKDKMFFYTVFLLKKNSIKKFFKKIRKLFKIKSCSWFLDFLKFFIKSNQHKTRIIDKDFDKKVFTFLQKEFHDDIINLSKTLNINLDKWYQ